MRLPGSRATVAVIAIIASTGCVPDAGLLVDLRTDLLPDRQFSLVRTELSTELPDVGAQTSVELVEHEASATDDYFAGARVAELTQLAPGGYWIRVTLLDDAGTRVAERLVRLDELRESRVITVVITSDCLGVVCPERLTCWNGSCVEPTCTGGDPASCGPPECEADADCPAAPACADARCVEGLCLNEAHTDRCMADEYCDALSGCTLAACGDASVAPTEGCDDGSLRDGDGCSATCELEPGWSCTGEPSTCLDVLPDAFAFVDVTGASPGVEYVSNEVLATGIEAPIDAAVTGHASAVLLIDGVASGRSATVSPGDRLALRMQASPSLATTSMAALSLGGVTASWAVTTFGGSCAAGTMTFATPGTVTFVVPAGCGHVSVRMWGAGGGGGRTPCVMLDGSGGGATTISRASGELVAAAGGGGGGPAHMSAGSGAYVEASLAVTEGEVLSLVVGAPGRRNAVDGGSAGSGPYGGPVGGGGLGLGDFVVPGNPPGDLTLRTAAPFGSASGFGSGGRSDGNCTDGPTDGGRGNIELRWGP